MKFKVARAAKHMWEEPVISGSKGSGTVFFCGCNLKCVYCQNYEISHGSKGLYVSEDQLVDLFLQLEKQGVHNINLVTPSPYIKALPSLLMKARSLIKVPIVYNTSAYESVEDLKALEGLVDIYLPDFKYVDSAVSKKYSGVTNYSEIASAAITEMRRQQPNDIIKKGIMTKGVIVRHLILPSNARDSFVVLDEIAKIDKDMYVSLMSQYFPTSNVKDFPELNRRITRAEYNAVKEHFFKVGLHNGFQQDPSSAIKDYTPNFDTSTLLREINEV